MTKLLISLLGAGAIATAGYAAAASVDTDPARTVSLPGATTNDDTATATITTAATTTDGVEDVSGPCDEAEHRNDPRCAGTGSPGPSSGSGGDDCRRRRARRRLRPVRRGRAPERPELHRRRDHRRRRSRRPRATTGNDDRGGEDRSGHGSGGGEDDRSGSNSGKG